ncbi:MBL fold metallo-hydrolase [Dethiobacter alkaliphilus]|uniref:beta-lactamase n=1 Tax=Dethiobacter alkaliphilus AHT 1 TaxID=555088 RepID=C0GKQ9_DETAL|nr:MBL fold metallo-hydrolase [Dethiobacter alkaliphilus]EEG76081.1 beta-lactamase domain protein [Dethiobacter alkaliphilus AHT 1]
MALELKKIAEHTYMIAGAVNIGVLINGDNCLLIDTGLDRQAGKQILTCLNHDGLTPKAIINTHSHADHFGGNAIIRQETGAKVYASPLEKAIIENPYLEPFYLFSAAPVKALKTRFLMAPASPVDGVLEPGTSTVAGFDVEIISLPGHSPGQIGVVTQDNICFTADAYFGESIIEKYGMPYTADVSAALSTLQALWQSDYAKYIPSHGDPAGKPTETILQNVSAIEKTLEQILKILDAGAQTREEILSAVITASDRKLDPVQYVLNHGAITACLSHLHKINKVEYVFNGGKMLWKTLSRQQACAPGG